MEKIDIAVTNPLNQALLKLDEYAENERPSDFGDPKRARYLPFDDIHYVYIAEVNHGELTKIGITDDPKGRSYGLRGKTRMLVAVPFKGRGLARSIEAFFIEIFADKCKKGREWFDLTDFEIKYAKDLLFVIKQLTK